MANRMAIFILMLVAHTRAQKFGEAKLMYEWKFLEFQWPSETEKQNRIADGSYVVNRSLLTGIKVFTYFLLTFLCICLHITFIYINQNLCVMLHFHIMFFFFT